MTRRLPSIVLAALGSLWAVGFPALSQEPLTAAQLLDVSPFQRDYVRIEALRLAWLPDSRTLLAELEDATAPGRHAIERLDVSGSGHRRLWSGSDPALSPDGRFCLFRGERDETVRRGLPHVAAVEGGAEPRVLDGPWDVPRKRHLAWAPDGMRFYFLGKEAGELRLYVALRDESGVRRVAEDVGDLREAHDVHLSWSPDGRRVLLGRAVPAGSPAGPPASGAATEASVTVYDGSEERELVPTELWLVEVDGGGARRLARSRFDFADLQWFPDGESCLYYHYSPMSWGRDAWKECAYVLDLATGNRCELIPGRDTRAARIAPGGTEILTAFETHAAPYYSRWGAAIVPARGPGFDPVVVRETGKLRRTHWLPDGSGWLAVFQDGVRSSIECLKRNGDRRIVAEILGDVSGLTVSPDGTRLAYIRTGYDGGVAICVGSTSDSSTIVARDLLPELATVALGRVEARTWKSPDGVVIHGLVVLPVRHEKARRYPLLVDVHGGPGSGVDLIGFPYTPRSPLVRHYWAGRGFAVLAPDYRESGHAGWDAVERTRRTQDLQDRNLDDILAGVDLLVAEGLADPERLAIAGFSHGAWLVNWAVTHTRRFKAAVSYEGYAEEFLQYGADSLIGGQDSFAWLRGGMPWEVPRNYERNSPAASVKGVTTPTLFISGEKGIANYHNEFLYTAWLRQGVKTTFLRYRGESHAVARKANQRDLLDRVTRWIEDALASP